MMTMTMTMTMMMRMLMTMKRKMMIYMGVQARERVGVQASGRPRGQSSAEFRISSDFMNVISNFGQASRHIETWNLRIAKFWAADAIFCTWPSMFSRLISPCEGRTKTPHQVGITSINKGLHRCLQV
jgi:hypothetical protein